MTGRWLRPDWTLASWVRSFIAVARLKGPCLILIIEWQLWWTNCVLCEIHKWLVHRYMYVSNICHGGGNGLEMLQSLHMWWWRSLLHIRHNMKSSDQGGEDQDEAWLNGPIISVKGKSEALKRGTMCDGEAWARLDADGPTQQWRASEVKIDEPIWSRDDMKWIISFGDWLVYVLHQHRRIWNGNVQGKGII
jgi:hypothetical protein